MSPSSTKNLGGTLQTQARASGSVPEYETAIIGAGFGGLGTAIRLQEEGRGSFIIFERASELGGTWRDNVYPGCACDIQSHLYSLSRNQSPSWSRQFASQQEILSYLNASADKFLLRDKLRCNTDIVELRFDEARAMWHITARDGYRTTARVVVMAIGVLNRPRMPDIPGLDQFRGESFHTSTWNNAVSLEGKRVAVVGTGASAIQVVPHVAKVADHLVVFQRSAPWIIPKSNRKYWGLEHALYKRFPSLLNFSRKKVFWVNEFRGRALLGNWFMRFVIELVGRLHIWLSMRNKSKRRLVQPEHRFGCKRVLLSNDYYPALDRENVQIVTRPIREIKEHCLIDEDGTEYPVDVLVLGTGFIGAEINVDMKVQGLRGRELIAEWANSTGPEAYVGTTLAGFPNLLMLLGPNTGLGHNSVVHIIESQLEYLIHYLRHLGEPGAYLDVTEQAQNAYNSRLQAKLSRSVWATGCRNWYTTASGKNSVIWPEGAHRFAAELGELHTGDYRRVVQQQSTGVRSASCTELPVTHGVEVPCP